MATPMPPVEPVTSAVLPVSCRSMSTPSCRTEDGMVGLKVEVKAQIHGAPGRATIGSGGAGGAAAEISSDPDHPGGASGKDSGCARGSGDAGGACEARRRG